MATAALTGTAAALGIPDTAPAFQALAGPQLTHGLSLLAATVAGTVAAGAAAQRATGKAVSNLFEAFAGLMFGLGLCFSGMTRPSVVRALDISCACADVLISVARMRLYHPLLLQVTAALIVLQPAWNATLFFVMAGALAVAMPLALAVIARRSRALDGSVLSLPCSTAIDARLLGGGVLFGAGWGAGGMCPGPALVAIGSLHAPQQITVLVASMVLGSALVVGYDKLQQGDEGVPPAFKRA